MKGFFFTRVYSPYKPYLDAQFRDFVRRDSDVLVFSSEPTRELSQRARRLGLARRVRTYPTTLSDVAAQLPSLLGVSLRDPRGVPGAVRCAVGVRGTLREKVRTGARAVALGREQPAFCLVHELETAVAFRWLRRRFPSAVLAMHYHGGEIPTIPQISDAVAADTFAAFDVIFTNTAFSAGQIADRGGDQDRIVVQPVGFALEDFQPPDRRAYRRDGALRLLAAGRVSAEKGFADALEALRRLAAAGLQKVRLSLAGDGPELGELRAFVARHGLEENVEFLGRLSHEGLIERMGRADALLLCSRATGNWAETQACVLQEAMLMRTPVIAARTGGVLESIPSELHHFSPRSGDPESIADSVARFAVLEPHRVEEFGRLSEAFARARYDVRALDDRLLEALGLGPGTPERATEFVP